MSTKLNRREFIRLSSVMAATLGTISFPEALSAFETDIVKNDDKKDQKMSNYPRAFSHIGITVPNIEEAVKFYKDVMGWYVMMEPTEVLEENNTAIGQMCIDVFGEGWGSFKIAHLSTSDTIGIELFEFPNNTKPKHEFNPYQTGVFHFCVKDPDIEGLTKKIVEAGGKQRMPIREYFPGEKPYKMVYCEDPFGNIVEIYTHSYELVYSQNYK